MASPSQPVSRYRRRILGIGAVAAGALYVIGAPIVNGRIESDLDSRVPIELAELGYPGVTASFSGQDGTLACSAPLDDPEAARQAAFGIRGVRAIDVDRSCRVNSARTDDAATEGDDDGASATTLPEATGSSAESADDATASTAAAPAETSPTTTIADLLPVADIVAANPDLTFVSVLLGEVDIGQNDDSVTLFAPSNDAFNAIPADVLASLQSDPELLRDVLSHHAVNGALGVDDFVDGELTALDGSALAVLTGPPITIDGATVLGDATRASNGVVHVIDRVLLPDGFSVEPEPPLAEASVVFDGTTLTLSGIVASEVERQTIVEAATVAVGGNNVVDNLTVDPEVGLDGPTAATVAELITPMPANLINGEAGFDGTQVYVTGTYTTDAGRDAYLVAAEIAGVTPTLEPPPEATEDDALTLEDQLNTFVADNPILFEPSSDVLSDSAVAVLDRVASDVQQFAGVDITIEGHTDSDGVPIENLQLSQNRANAVRDALIQRGIAAEVIDAVGFGSEQPVLVDGSEDKAASRRVEFRVVTTQ